MRIQFRNKEGTPVDPVPFLIVSVLGFLVAFSFGPAYLSELGLRFKTALVVCTITVSGTTIGAYFRYVWTARPILREEIPISFRLRRLYYGVGLGLAVIALLALPLVLR